MLSERIRRESKWLFEFAESDRYVATESNFTKDLQRMCRPEKRKERILDDLWRLFPFYFRFEFAQSNWLLRR